MNKKWIFTLVLGICLSALGAASRARADGLLLVNGVYRQPASSHINVSIANKIATTVLEQKFHNNLDTEVSATYVAPVPADATVTSFAELLNDKWVDASIQSSEQAQQAFT